MYDEASWRFHITYTYGIFNIFFKTIHSNLHKIFRRKAKSRQKQIITATVKEMNLKRRQTKSLLYHPLRSARAHASSQLCGGSRGHQTLPPAIHCQPIQRPCDASGECTSVPTARSFLGQQMVTQSEQRDYINYQSGNWAGEDTIALTE